MGNSQSRKGNETENTVDEGNLFITFEGYRSWPKESFRSKYDVFLFHVRYQRYHWVIDKRFSEILSLEKKLKKVFPSHMNRLSKFRPVKYTKMFWNHDAQLLQKRGKAILRYLQLIFKENEMLLSHPSREFLEIGKTSFHPQLGRKGKEGWLQKSSGGYITSSAGEFIKTWRTRWFVLHDTYFAYYSNEHACEPLGFMQIDQKFEVFWKGRMLTVSNKVRKLTLHAPNLRTASNWFEAFNSFYKMSFRRNNHPLLSTFPPRPSSSVRLYVCGKEYFMALCIALLQAREEIFIASWMVSPTQLLTRPPLPPLRLDQVLKFKAEQGVRVYILLYKEVEMSGTGNDSLKSKLYLESLSPNISVIRHPNKILGSSTAILWSHHEKLVIVDRDLAFAGGIDPCFGRWDDTSHSLTDEAGTRFPGTDYYQPARGLFRPVNSPPTPTGQTADSLIGSASDRLLNEFDSDDKYIVVTGDESDDGINQGGDDNSDQSDDAPSVTSSLSCNSYLDDDINLFRDRRIGDSIGSLTEDEFHAISSQGKYELSGGGTVAREGHIGPPFAPHVHSTGPQVVRAVPATQSRIHVQSVPVGHQSSVHGSTVQAATTAVYSASTSIVVQSTPLGGLYGNDMQPHHHFQQRQQQQQQQQQQQFQHQNHQGQLHQQSHQYFHFQRGQVQEQSQIHQSYSTQPLTDNRSHIISSTSYESIQTFNQDASISTSTRSIYTSMSSTITPSKTSTSTTNVTDDSDTVGGKFSTWLKNFSDGFEDKNAKIPNSQLREQYPRMPWHDVHASVAGLPARDLGAHFVMRWNHHKKSKGTTELRYLTDVSDITHFGVCAKCRLEKIFETLEKCPNCGHTLGPIKRSLNITKNVDLMTPSTLEDDIVKNTPDEYKAKALHVGDAAPTFITFRCKFTTRLGCRIQGDGPVVVTQICDEVAARDGPSTLISQQGDTFKLDALRSQGLRPMIGDVVTVVNGSSVLHLATEQLQRLLIISKNESTLRGTRSDTINSEYDRGSEVKRLSSMSITSKSGRRSSRYRSEEYKLVVCFRRYYTDDSPDIVKGDVYYKNMAETLQTLKDKVHNQVLIRQKEEEVALNQKVVETEALLTMCNVDDVNNDCDGNLASPATEVKTVAEVSRDGLTSSCAFDQSCLVSDSDDVIVKEMGQLIPEDQAQDIHNSEDNNVRDDIEQSNVDLDIDFCLIDEFENDDVDIPVDSKGVLLVNNGYLTPVEADILSMAANVTGHSIPILANSNVACDKMSGSLPYYEDSNKLVPAGFTVSQKEMSARKEYKVLYDKFVNYGYLDIRRDLVCRVATSMEVNRMMLEFQDLSKTSFGELHKDILPSPGALSGTCHVQVLRSVSDWSIGQAVEQSIHNGWIEAIGKAQHFVYIENQFFISSLGGSSIKNGIAKALLDRIVLAVQQNAVFKVIVVVPLHPEGDFVHTSGPRGVLNFQYKTICRGKQSLIAQLRRRLQPLNRDPLEYITFNSLRTYGSLQGRFVTEQIYVHDKLLIVDDRVLIMGSANVNDRSMLGDRDSEVALRIEDTVHVSSRMNGAPWSAGALPHAFRKRLMSIHLGDSVCDLTDPICEKVYRDIWLQTAKENTEIYHELDGPASYETCPTIKAYDSAISNKALLYIDDPLVEAHLCRIKGHLVFWPQNFLSKEVMSFSGSTNAVLPSDLFT